MVKAVPFVCVNMELDELRVSRAGEIAGKICQLKTWLLQAKGEGAFFKKMHDEVTALLRLHEMRVDGDAWCSLTSIFCLH